MIIYCLFRWPIGKVSKYFFFKKRSEYLHILSQSLLPVFVDNSACSRMVAVMHVALDPKAENVLLLSMSRTLLVGRENRLEV